MELITRHWLDHVCQMLPQVKKGVVVFDFSETAGDIASAKKIYWPDSTFDSTELMAAVILVTGRSTPLCIQASKDGDGAPPTIIAAYPLTFANKPCAVVVIELVARSAQQDVIKQILQWGEGWLQLLLQQSQQQSAEQVKQGASDMDNCQYIIRAVEAGLEFASVQQSVVAVATSLAQDLGCQRIAIGLLDGGKIKVKGLSYSASFDPRSNLIWFIEAVMGEAREQKTCITYTSSASGLDYPAHRCLSNREGAAEICSVPLLLQQSIMGVIVIEAGEDSSIGSLVANHYQWIGKVLAPVFAIKQSQGLVARMRLALKTLWAKSLGPERFQIKLGAVSLVLLGLLLLSVKGEYRISAPAILEGRIQRAVVAPFEGYVAKAMARAGDVVKMGDVIAELDTRELNLQHRRLLGRKNELQKQYRKALAALNHPEARIAQTQIAQAESRLQLLQQQLQRAQLRAPLDGIIISGDLNRSLGAPVERGQVLFEVAPLKEYRLVLHIDQREIADIAVGQRGSLFLAAFPRQELPFVIEQVATVFNQQGEQVNYRTEAHIETDVSNLRPGMQGVGKVVVGDRPYRWIVFHRLADWIRLQVWSWMP